MPYRLRRVIGVNIRNPRNEGPSLRLAELDTRGAVIAAGRNGVGKTSFLRLIPLFYGATPTRILRGSGLNTMIRYMLPHPSSAVAYEYERESEADLRCVVMHCRPDEDAPQFHILRGGFEDRFFYDDSDTFVTREAFKARVEGFGVVVEQKLTLSEYRSIILNERSSSKQVAVLRSLAGAHSLAPVGTSLQGLDHIAAAMGNEKISFRDLQDIVVERIASSISEEGSRNPVRQIRKNASTVSSWLTGLQHLRDLSARKADAERLMESCRKVQTLSSYIRELRSSAKLLASEASVAAVSLRKERGRVEEQGLEKSLELGQLHSLRQQESAAAKMLARQAEEVVEATQARQAHFASINIERLVAEEDLESSMLARQRVVNQELAELKDVAQGIQKTYEAKLSELTQWARGEDQRLSRQRSEHHELDRTTRQTLATQEEAALANLAKPKRLMSLPSEIGKQQALIGELGASLRNPAIPSKIVQDLESVATELVGARRAERSAAKEVRSAADEERQALRAQEAALREHESVASRVRALKDERTRLENDLKPPAGSLQEFLRSSQHDDAPVVAKVVSPALAKRADLNPVEVSRESEVVDGVITVGPYALQVRSVEVPDWFDERDVQRQVQGINKQVETAEAYQTTAAKKLEAATKAYTHADQALTVASSTSSAARAAVEALEKRESVLQETRVSALKSEERRIAEALSLAKTRLADLEAELKRLQEEHDGALMIVRVSFANQRETLGNQTNAALKRVDEEEAEVLAREEAQKVELLSVRDSGLSAAGIKPQELTTRENELQKLGERLRKVGDSRHEVQSWRVFSSGSLATLEADIRQSELLAAESARAYEAESAAEKVVQEHANDLKRRLEALDREIETKTSDAQALTDLLANQLAPFADAPTTRILRVWNVEDLLREVHLQLRELDLASHGVDSLYQALRSVMRRNEGIVSDWLAQAEGSLQNMAGYPEFEVRRLRGENICRWFQGDFASATNALQQELTTILGLAAGFVRDMEVFNRQVAAFNSGLQRALKSVTGFDNFRDLEVQVRSGVTKLEYLDTLQKMHDISISRVAILRGSGVVARDIELPEPEVEPLIRSFRDLLQQEGGISVNFADQIRLECSLTINRSRVVISNEDEFRARASNGNSALIVAMFLMGFAQMIRKDAPVRITWVTDEIGRFDSGNVNAFLETLDANHIDVISAAPQADPSMLYMFDRHCVFRKDGSIWEHAEGEAIHAA
ncbi:ATP-binding protein [uncultured Hydrogenophaga sp.]|uniref:ATP-binding protein n=1 Tax=uncultured Hydrogenophaga sp. TaxID=199683 RepID=UPI002589EE7E|nr:ATP-binding protein [uncultured Hydrogenophaga sp.]